MTARRAPECICLKCDGANFVMVNDLGGQSTYWCPICGDLDRSAVKEQAMSEREAQAWLRREKAERSLKITPLVKWMESRRRQEHIEDLLALRRELMSE